MGVFFADFAGKAAAGDFFLFLVVDGAIIGVFNSKRVVTMASIHANEQNM